MKVHVFGLLSSFFDSGALISFTANFWANVEIAIKPTIKKSAMTAMCMNDVSNVFTVSEISCTTLLNKYAKKVNKTA